eukprot:CAMPEP_0197530254 /NCGR_PEP_ID=MMETSP1318-20131121/31249_1 /TAXON_ID=552666 /ORGANISM="Partenskyella glossopodia, Strain RCC365" /LENGTH=268 /DNA_ID=CAMNT_0043085989 /DNA_START=87 /DNA_END=893 /DNA_ORIENTATION=-
MRKTFRYIPDSKLTVSEPNPMHFGNSPNEKENKAWTNPNWLKSRFHFSFAEYHNPKNSNFGVLRVMNDDLVQPKRGFGTHPHRDMEIVTYIIQGQLTHQDSMGTKESLGRGSVQFMTAGTGIRHSEHNIHDKPLRFIQMWLIPWKTNLKPNYGSMCGSKIDFKNQWAHVVSSTKSEAETPVKINCDANIKVVDLDDTKQQVEFELGSERQAYLLAMEGSPTVSGGFGEQSMKMHDAAELSGPEKYRITGPGHVLVVEMENDGSGRGDI